MDRWLFFADTPLQMYNAALTASALIEQGDHASLLVYDQFAQASDLAIVYEKIGVFDEIEVVPHHPIHEYRQQLIWQIGSRFGKKNLAIRMILDSSYDHLAIACPTPATFEVFQRLLVRNKKLRVSFYEDGTGSYNGAVFKTVYSFDEPPLIDENEPPRIHQLRAIINALRLKRFLYRPERLFLKNPSLLAPGIDISTCQINPKQNVLDKLEAAFAKEPLSLPPAKNIIVLDTARYQEPNPETEAIDHLLEQIIELEISPFLRKHPRSVTDSVYTNSCQDLSGGFWELFCHKEAAILSDALLISIGSTAQLSPIIEGNAKPFLMFLYKLAFSETDSLFKTYEYTVCIAQDCYGVDSDRILIPKSLEEAKDQIRAFIS